MSLSKYYEHFVILYELYDIYNLCLKLDIINMTATNSTQEFVEQVKSYPAIYDRQNPNHSNIKEKELIWKNLSAQFNCDAKRKWNSLRDKYVREKKKERANGAIFVSSWDYFTCMNFLENHIKPRKQPENDEISQHSEDSDESEEIDVKAFYGDFCKEMAALDEVGNTNISNSFKETNSLCNVLQKMKDSEFNLTKSNSNSIRKSILRTLEIFRENLQNMNSLEEDDEDILFLGLIANKMKKMTHIEKSNFQMEMLRDADEFLFR